MKLSANAMRFTLWCTPSLGQTLLKSLMLETRFYDWGRNSFLKLVKFIK